MANSVASAMARWKTAERFMQTSIAGGAMLNALTEVAVMAKLRPSCLQVTTLTELASRRSASFASDANWCVSIIGRGLVNADRLESEPLLAIHCGDRLPVEAEMQRRRIGVAPEALQRRGQIAARGALLGE